MNKKDKKAAKMIIAAQIASDAGKHIYEINGDLGHRARKYGYDIKADYIYDALNIISKQNNSIFRYSVTKGADQNGYSSILVYFEFKKGTEKFQISFHCYEWEYFENFLNSKKNFHMKWDHKDSRESCEVLQAMLYA